VTDLAKLELRVKSLEVKTASDRLDKMTRSSRRAEEQTSRLSRSFTHTNRLAGRLNGNYARMVLLIGKVLVGLGGIVSLTKSITLAAKMEQIEIGFETLIGSQERSMAMLKELEFFAATTPFQFRGLADSTKLLLAMGFEAEKVIPTMRVLGDATAALGGGQELMKRLIIALGQIRAKGAVQSQEIRQLAEAGIPAWEILAEKIGVSIPEAMKLVENRAVASAGAIDAILQGMNERFEGSTERLAQSTGGLFSTLKDNIEFALRDVGTVLIDVFDLKGLMRTAISETSDYAKIVADVARQLAGLPVLYEENARFAKQWADVLVFIGKILIVIVAIKFIEFMISLGVQMLDAYRHAKLLAMALFEIVKWMTPLIAMAVGFEFGRWIGSEFKAVRLVLLDFVAEAQIAWEKVKSGFLIMVESIKAGWDWLIEQMNDGAAWLVSRVGAMFGVIQDAVPGAEKLIGDVRGKLNRAAWDIRDAAGLEHIEEAILQPLVDAILMLKNDPKFKGALESVEGMINTLFMKVNDAMYYASRGYQIKPEILDDIATQILHIFDVLDLEGGVRAKQVAANLQKGFAEVINAARAAGVRLPAASRVAGELMDNDLRIALIEQAREALRFQIEQEFEGKDRKGKGFWQFLVDDFKAITAPLGKLLDDTFGDLFALPKFASEELEKLAGKLNLDVNADDILEKVNEQLKAMKTNATTAKTEYGKLLKDIELEILLAGEVDSARRKLIFERKFGEFIDEEKLEKLKHALSQLEFVERLEEGARRVSEAFGGAAEDILFDFENAGDIISDMFEEIGRSLFRTFLIDPIVDELTRVLTDAFGASEVKAAVLASNILMSAGTFLKTSMITGATIAASILTTATAMQAIKAVPLTTGVGTMGVPGFQRGGLIDRLTYFMTSGGMKKAGEAGKEVILPVEQLPSGKWGIESRGTQEGGTEIHHHSHTWNVPPGMSAQSFANRRTQRQIQQEMDDYMREI
jgi:tape measure domain-containing protein